MSTLDATRAELGLVVQYLNKAEARDKICRAIQYGSKFLGNGEPGTAQNVDKSTSLARKVFRLQGDGALKCFCVVLQFVNDLHALISPTPQGTPFPLVLLGKLGKLGRFSAWMKKLEKDLKNTNIYHNEEYRAKLKKSNERSLA
ncbi:hypothetical protein FEM48_Zijuj07G0166500 [Ziziphus jujuba var. spinosa]|uniref:Uncharacterized protein n=1 Tax=Ziziphus jujuba var. spinosa TaxID=714518 RepID=A0A978V5R8_ZIZJJ|nr:hypothetical protein FEM48_Zijuj07G0166500 [Ziziphus jujuba var. spinosa]